MSDQDQFYETIEPEKFQDAYNPQPTVVVNQVPKDDNGMAIASLVIGIVSMLLSCCGLCFPFIGGIMGLVFGIISLAQKRQGRGMAIAGIILSALAIVMGIIVSIVYLVFSISY